MKKSFFIQDWDGNILSFDGYFKRPQLAVAMEFESFDDGWEYIDINFPQEDHEDLYVKEIEQ